MTIIIIENFDSAVGWSANEAAVFTISADEGVKQEGTASLKIITKDGAGAALSKAGWTASASNSAGGKPPSNAIDGDTGTRWQSGIEIYNGLWFKVNLGQLRKIYQTRYYWCPGGESDWPANGYKIETSPDNSNWTQVYSGASNKDDTRSFTAKLCQYVRATCTAAYGGHWLSLIEHYLWHYPIALNDYVHKTIDAVNLTGVDELKIWVRSTRTGTNFQFGFGETVYSENLSNITISSANTWEEKTIDISGISDANKNAVTKLGFKVTNVDSNFTFYSDYLYYEIATKTQTITAKARIKAIISKTINAKARIKKQFTQTITAKGDIKKQIIQTIQALGRITGLGQTITAKALIKKTQEQTITVKGDILREFTQSLTIKANIKETISQIIQAKGRILALFIQTITVKGSIGLEQARTITTKGNIELISPQTITAKAYIYNPLVPTPAFRAEIAKTVRQLTPKVEIQWDGATWTDESDYFISARGNEQLWKISGEGIAATLDIELDNTTERFTPDNALSPIYQYLKPRTSIRVYITAGGYDYKIFTGYIKNIHPDVRSRICSLECFDNQVFVYNKRANGVVYEDHRTDQLLTELAELAGLQSSQYEFDVGTHTVNFGYFEDRNVWPIMGEIAVAERGRIFFDRQGILTFWNRDRLHNKTASDIIPDITLNNWIIDLDYSVAEHEIKNTVIVKATPRASAGIQVVWSSGNAEYLDPYSDTLVWIPKNSSQVAWLEMEDPCTTFIIPIRNDDFTANSAQDGLGVDLTNNISIHPAGFISYGNAVFITVINNGDTDAYLTKFQIRGNPAQILKWIKVTAKDLPSITRYGRQEFEIENNFIDSEDTAREIAQEELYRRKEAVNLFRVNIVGIPHLLCGDVVNIEYRAGSYKNYMIDQLDWTFDNGGFMQKLTLVNPYIFPEIKTIDARAYIVIAHYIETVTVRARIAGKKNVEAKANIKAEKIRTIQGMGQITL